MIRMQQLCPSRSKRDRWNSYRGHSLERLSVRRWKCSYCDARVTEAALARRGCVSPDIEDEILTEKLLAFLPRKRMGDLITPTIEVEKLAVMCGVATAEIIDLTTRHGPLYGSFRLARTQVGFQLPEGLAGRVFLHHQHGEHRYG